MLGYVPQQNKLRDGNSYLRCEVGQITAAGAYARRYLEVMQDHASVPCCCRRVGLRLCRLYG